MNTPKHAKPATNNGRATPEVTQAQRRAAVILEVLAGVRSAPEAAEVLKISSNHYYILERKALAGLVAACQPAPRRGPPVSAERELEKLRREVDRLRGECQRQAALVRATQRAVGVPLSSENDSKPKRRRGKAASKPKRRRREPRGVRAARALRKSIAGVEALAVQQQAADESTERKPPVREEQTDGSSGT